MQLPSESKSNHECKIIFEIWGGNFRGVDEKGRDQMAGDLGCLGAGYRYHFRSQPHNHTISSEAIGIMETPKNHMES